MGGSERVIGILLNLVKRNLDVVVDLLKAGASRNLASPVYLSVLDIARVWSRDWSFSYSRICDCFGGLGDATCKVRHADVGAGVCLRVRRSW